MESIQNEKRGKLIVFEGLDRSGKTTQCSLLAAKLRNNGLDVVEMKFPDRTTEIGKMINAHLTNSNPNLSVQAIHLLFSANRWELSSQLERLVSDGKIVIVDRYSYSGTAFSSAKGLDLKWCQAPDVGLPEPDKVIFLDVDEATAADRGGYGEEIYETQSMQRRVREQFQLLRKPDWSWINAAGSEDQVFAEISRVVIELFK